jgi:raffinose/stachyose/melibiose transport system permease protein
MSASNSISSKNITTKLSTLIYCAFLGAVIVLPLYLVFISSFKTTEEIYTDYLGLPNFHNLENYMFILKGKNIVSYFINSFYVTATSILLINLITPFTAYIIAKNYKKKLYKYIYMYFLILIFIPFNVIVFPLTKLLYNLHLMNLSGLIFCYVALSIPENIFLYVAYFRTINKDIFDAAQIDGCDSFQYYLKVLLPISLTILITVNILNIIWIWNDFFLPLMIINSNPSSWTLPIFIYHFKGQYSFSVNQASAAYQISIIPIVILFVTFQDTIIKGAAMQSNKENKLQNIH